MKSLILIFIFLVTGTLKGYDQLMNLVLDNVSEVTRGTFSTLRSSSNASRLSLLQIEQEN
jgi:small nuclear ribonucleoprotein (snRNP)-like protein